MSTLRVEALEQPDGTAFIFNNKNLLINGGMNVWQRSTSQASISSTSTDGYVTVDRWTTYNNSLGTWTQSRSTDVPSEQGFGYSLKMDCTTADASPAAGDELNVAQLIEAQNLQHLLFGTSSPKSITLSFWVKSNKTGTYIINIYKTDGGARGISKSYTIDTASTWEKKEITFAGDETNAIANDNGVGLYVNFYLAAGSNYTSGTLATSWESLTNANRAVGQVNLADSTSNEWYLTGCQLEVGSTASGFEFEPYATTLTKCTRYLHKITNVGGGNFASVGSGIENSSTQAFIFVPHITPMRDQPSMSYSNLTHFDLEARDKVPTAISTTTPDTGGMTSTLVVTVSSGLSVGGGALLIMDQAGYIEFDAEL